jgi:1-acyl-sn-glycerol-3-phosphate acyltransferase
VKAAVYTVAGAFTYAGLSVFNKLRIQGIEHLKSIPKKNVLFVSNHQTYFKDVIALMHVFGAARLGKKNKLGIPFHLVAPPTNIYYVAASETMNSNIISKALKMAGAISVNRTWRANGQDVLRERNESDTKKIDEALQDGWVITFPQGTTKPFAVGRKGTAHIIKNNKPTVVPIVIDGFAEAFGKKGLRFKKMGVPLTINIKEPLSLDYSDSVENILALVMHAIEQSEEFKPDNTDFEAIRIIK